MRSFTLALVFFHLLLYAAIGSNIPFFRQIIVFIYLSFVPGFVLLNILKLNETGVVNAILLSVGLSIAFLMFVGALMNWVCPILGISTPLSTIPLTITLSLSVLVLIFVSHLQDSSPNLSLSVLRKKGLRRVILKSLIVILPVPLAIIGALYVNVTILLLMIMAIAVLFALSLLSPKIVPVELYSLVISAISLALVFHFSLISKHIIGYDSPLEYYVYRLTEISAHWTTIGTNIYPAATNYSSLLSITILPTIYHALMNIDGETIFKVVYPFVFSLVPLTLYEIYQKQVGKLAALSSALFFISGSQVFYGVGPLSLNRQIIAEFFFVLSVLLLLDKGLPTKKRRALLIVFGTALIVSHYSLAYLFLLYILFTFVVVRINGSKDDVLNMTVVVSLFVMAFLWNSFVSISPLIALSDFLGHLSSRFFTDIYNPAARSSDIFRSHSVLTIASVVNWAFFFTSQFFVGLGILRLIFKSRERRLDLKYRAMAILSAIILFLCIAVPNFAPSLNFERFYAITLLFLAPCFVLGAKTLLDIGKTVWERTMGQHHVRNAYVQAETLLLCIVLIGYFVSQSGFINHVTGAAPQSYSLDLDRMRTSSDLIQKISLYNAFHPEEEYDSVIWLLENAGNTSRVYADFMSVEHLLYDYGQIPMERLAFLFNDTYLSENEYIYLRRLNVGEGVILPSPSQVYNTTEISPLLKESNEIYSNGYSEIYRSP